MKETNGPFQLWNRYQDEWWQPMEGELFEFCGDAICKASEYASNAIVFGMVKVVDRDGNDVHVYPAGKGCRG